MNEPTRTRSFEVVLRDELAQIAAARSRSAPAGAVEAAAATDPTPAEVVDITAAEREALAAPRTGSAPIHASHVAQRMRLTGIAFSGGGIRSATFNLGLTQALCEAKLLRRFDYLSTVSGGGYIGSWLSALLHEAHVEDRTRSPRRAIEGLEDELSPCIEGQPKAHEAKAIGFLRQYSNYLTPRVGLLSTDSLSAISTYIRNVLLIQTMVIALLLAFLVFPRVLYAASACFSWAAGWLGMGLIVASAVGIGINLRADKESRMATTRFVLTFVVSPAVIGAFLLAIDFSNPTTVADSMRNWISGSGDLPQSTPIGWWIGAMAALYGGLSAIISLLPSHKKATPLLWSLLITVAGIIAGALGGAGLWTLRNAMASAMSHDAALWLAVSIAPFIILSIFGLMVIVHLGLIGRLFDYQLHEWWARYGAWIFGVTIGIGGIFAIAVYGPVLVEYGRSWIVYAGGPIWLLTTLWGVLAGKSATSSGKDSAAQSGTGPVRVTWTDRLLPLAPYVFILGLALALSYALYRGFGGADFAAEPYGAVVNDVLRSMTATTGRNVVVAFLSFLAVFTLFAWRVDINLFSLHNFYRNRLTRCYLGAARAASGKRKPHPFTGFDTEDDVRLSELVAGSGTVQRPYHILNTALNMSTGENLAWQNRKAAAFFFTPQYCGFELPPSGDPDEIAGGFVRTSDYMPTASAFGPSRDNGPMLGSVVAVSGAAASPNAGFHTSKAVAFLLTLFNVRLGRWCPNTARTPVVPYQSPAFGGGLLLQELFGSTDACSKWVYLSDGGHFDNLGIYELVRRRVAIIVVGDCGQDVPMRFDDLADTMRKCYTDFGVRIDLDVGPCEPGTEKGKERFIEKSVITGNVCYPAHGTAPAFRGRLVLVKPGLNPKIYGRAPDIRNYALSNADFPQQTTADQFFDEAQFESYRKLGYLIGSDLLDTEYDRANLPGRTVRDLLEWV